MNKNQKLIYKNNSYSIEFSLWSNYIPTKILGLCELNNNINIQKQYGIDGAIINGKETLDIRNIVIQGHIFRNKNYSLEYLKKAFNPKIKGEHKLIWIENDNIKSIDCIIEKLPTIIIDSIDFIPKFTISLICLDPMWQDINFTKHTFSNFINNFSFPIILNKVILGGNNTKINLNNKGDCNTPVRLTIMGNGNINNTIIKNNTTKEFIQINMDKILQEDDKFVIDGYTKTIAFNNTNCYCLTLESTIFDLQIGENNIEFVSNNDGLKLILEYKKKYITV